MRVPGSFRDPCGSVYIENGEIVRSVNLPYMPDYECLQQSGLLRKLWDNGWMVPFKEDPEPRIPEAWKTLHVKRIPFVSFPYEWSFSQLKAAALLTLDIQEAALKRGMTLKDASAYNIQFEGTRPVCVDCLSLERLTEDKPWVGYAQFCRHFVAPLLLMARVNLGLGTILLGHIDGIPLEIASAMLPLRTRFSFGTQLHLHLHARMQRRHDDSARSAARAKDVRVSAPALLNLVGSLRSLVEGLKLPALSTPWSEYYNATNYSREAFDAKREYVAGHLADLAPATVLDLGANVGTFSRVAAERARYVISAEMDPLAVERNYLSLRNDGVDRILPLVVNLCNPSPSLGWHCEERPSFIERCDADTVLALALIHHLSIGNNVPLEMSARLFASLGKSLILEFVPKEDSQVRQMLSTRKDVFDDYSLESLLAAYDSYFSLMDRRRIPGSERSILLFTRKGPDPDVQEQAVSTHHAGRT